jgi:hypothetical protein
VNDAASGTTFATGSLVISVVLAVVGVVIWPFVFEPIAVIFFLVSARATPSRRFTGPVAGLISVCFVLGAALAVALDHALY